MKLISTFCTLIVLWLLLFPAFLSAQRTISGIITDSDTREGLIGASVLVEGTTTGTVADFDGNYSLVLPDGATTLIFSYTGYATQYLLD